MNVLGAIMDATFPHKSFKSKRYICSLKIADPTLPVDTDGCVQTISVVLFADSFKDLPVCQQIGQLIRIHRATVSTFKESIQLTVNICFNSSWVIFPGKIEGKISAAREGEPFAFFGKSVHTTLDDIKKLRAMRRWVTSAFSEKLMLKSSFITPLSQVRNKFGETEDKKFYDFDLQVKVC